MCSLVIGYFSLQERARFAGLEAGAGILGGLIDSCPNY